MCQLNSVHTHIRFYSLILQAAEEQLCYRIASTIATAAHVRH